ncbi:ROK family protein [Streptomyces sp. WMMB 322]|uniref:ROK family protein n=1 Tax=Streptomyces sp. WMMB 322 TaxID=1286821 RepID=UPI0006E25273|nr:ROK family protein [Streptomyces sp. WMMB 322]SCK18692.1 glucokinase [Streptomyces sp. WMMB 322]
MSRPTLLARLAPLAAAGLIYETGARAAPRGRPAQLIRFDDRHLRILTVDVGHTRARVSVTDVYGGELRSRQLPVDMYEADADTTLGPLLDLAAELLDAGAPEERLVGVGMGLPAPIDPATGLPKRAWIIPKWSGHPVRERIQERWNVPVLLENDARALALGESTVHDAGTLLAVKWSNGIGAGLVVDGRLHSGEDGAAGDIGHIRIPSSRQPDCRCGLQGCLAAYASGHALLRELGLPGLDEIVRRNEAGDAGVGKALEAAGGHVGDVLAMLISMLNPKVLVLGGVIGRIATVVDAVGHQVRTTALSHSTAGLTVVPGTLGEQAVPVGLARLVADHVLDPALVDASLEAGA